MNIVHYPHPALRHPAKPITSIDAEIRRYAAQMIDLMYENKGLGLAAPQVALPFQLLVMNFAGDPERKDQECVAINPIILERKGHQEETEGCLSFPGLYQKVRRARSVTVQAYDLDGRLFEMRVSDLPARIWQHEVDHLIGVLFIDKMGTLGKISARGSLREFEATHRRLQDRGELPADHDLERALVALEAARGA
jgi:peptide deformylase